MVLASNLILKARQRADQIGSLFVTEDEALSYLNQGYKTLYNIIIQGNQDYFIDSQDLTLVDQQQEYPLPNNFYKMRGVDLMSGAQPITLRPFSFNERNRYRYANLATWAGPAYRYHMAGSNLKFTPIPGTGTLRIYYIPNPVEAATTASTLDTQGFDEYLVVYVAKKMLEKEESDVSSILQELLTLKAEVQSMVANRDKSFPKVVVDIELLNDNLLFPGMVV
jgi:hypothetical protein